MIAPRVKMSLYRSWRMVTLLCVERCIDPIQVTIGHAPQCYRANQEWNRAFEFPWARNWRSFLTRVDCSGPRFVHKIRWLQGWYIVVGDLRIEQLFHMQRGQGSCDLPCLLNVWCSP
jgi:hypothetical protein